MTYIFDFDGTLVDSMDVWAGSHIKKLEENGISVPDDFVSTITPLGNLNASKYTISLGIDVTLDEYLEDISRKLNFEYRHNVKLKSNVKSTLEKLKSEGVSLNVFTASPHSYIDDCLKINGVYHLFDNVWSISDFGHTKDEIIAYKLLVERLGVDISECVFFDDNLVAVKTSKKAGLTTVAVYDKYSKPNEKAMREIADYYINDFSEIFDF